MSRKNRFFYERIFVSWGAFNVEPDLTLDLIDPESLLFVNENSGVIVISFDGINPHGELNPSIGIASLVIDCKSVNKIWFRLKAGSPSGVSVQNNATVSSTNTVNLGTVTITGTASNFGDFFPLQGTAAGFSNGTDMKGARVYDINTNGGEEYTLGVVLRSSSPTGSVELGTASNPLRIEPSGTTAQPVTDNGGSLTIDTTQLPAALVGGRLDNNIGSWLGSTAPTVGQKAMAESIPVVIASDQSKVLIGGVNGGGTTQAAAVFDVDTGAGTQYVFGTVLRASSSGGSVETGTASNALRIDPTGTTAQPVTDNGGSLTVDTTQLPAALVGGRLDNNVGSWLGSTAPTVGQKTMDNSVPVVIASNQTVIPISDNSSSLTVDTPQLPAALVGGRLDNNVGAWLGSTAPTVGQKTMTNSVPVVISSDQSKVLIGGDDGSATQAARVYDVDSGAGTEYVLGTVLRASAPGGSVETGTASNPLRVEPAGDTKQSVKLYDGNGSLVKATISQELKVAQLYTLADLTSKYELDARIWDVKTATGGTASHLPNQSAIEVAVTGASGSTAGIVTNTYYKYQSSYTQLINMSVINSDTGQANQVREWGYFDDGDGVFFRLSGTSFYIVERTSTSGSPVETTYLQSSWNVDPLDGTGPSGVNLNLSKGNIFEIELQWFGVGTARYSINGILVHEVAHANTLNVPYLKTATLPVQLKVTNSGISSAGSLRIICARVAAQGQIHDPFEWVYSVISPSDKLVGLTEIPILSIRPKSTYNSIVNRALILPKKCTVSTEGYKLSFKILYDATLTGASWASADARSSTEYDTSASSYSGGELIYRGFIPLDTDSKDVDLLPFFDIFGRILRNAGYNGSGVNLPDSLTIVALCEAVGTTKVRVNLTWAEIR